MDRFTRFQELTRMMAESVNDVATVQRGLQRSLQATEDELAAQARLTRDLQDDLLRTRMVEFESMADRLYRVVRQAAKETGKQVRLDIVGGSIEVDRGVLDRMTGPFEHLLRNSVAHGIERPDTRTAAGKEATGTISIHLAQEGNEVAVEFRDDGAGLNLARIRERAVAMGLLAADAPASDAELANMIFAPGFSTADSVSELSGRGVGMDVVRAEVNAMGGRIETATAAGQGASFRLVLPLTTAVTQVVMLRCGELSIAVPSTLVELVRRVSSDEIEQSYASGAFALGDKLLPFFWLGALLQTGGRGSSAGRSQPVVVIRSASQRVALHVDDVLGNQEVVVKNLGPQLSRLPGLAGITLLPSGAVALIYNPVALATLYGDGAREQVRRVDGGDVVEVPVPVVTQPPLVLVVDDSLTVRRVTQRLLSREGYRVKLAKDGLDALDKLREELPAVVLSDIEMPRMDGFDLVRNMRSDARLAGLPVIMITSRIAQKHRDYAAQLGVKHYLGKPYSEEELLALVGRHVQAAAALRSAHPRSARGAPPQGGPATGPAKPDPRRRPDFGCAPCSAWSLEHRVALQRALARRVVQDHRHRVVLAHFDVGRGQVDRPGQPGGVDQLVGQPGQLRKVAADESAGGIELLALAHRVEDAEPGLRIAAGRRRPLPAAVVGGEIVVVQVFGKVGLAATPVQAQVLDQETGHHHAKPVVHVAAAVDLVHGSVHQRIAGTALAPRGKQLVRMLAVLPLDAVVVGLEGVAYHMGVVVKDLVVEVAPDQFAQPHLGAAGVRSGLGALPGLARQVPDRHRAEAQVRAQVAGPLDGRVVAGLVVAADALAQKVVQQFLAAGAAAGQLQQVQVGRLKANVGQCRHGLPQRRRQRGQRAGMVGHRVGLQEEWVDLLQPCVLVRREHAVGIASLGEQLVALEDDMVLDGMHRHANVGQPSAHARVARQGGGVVVVIGIYRLRAQNVRQRRDLVDRVAMPHDQPAALDAVRTAQRAQLRVQADQAVADEFHPAVLARQRVEDASVEDKHAPHLAGGAQGVVQGGMVVGTQVAPEPQQGTVQRLGHGPQCACWRNKMIEWPPAVSTSATSS
jgi:CheY-like chemotaxis protein